MSINDVPREMRKKFEHILAMDLDQLNDAYLRKLDEMGLPFPPEQPTLDLIYKLLIPEIFELAAQKKRARLH